MKKGITVTGVEENKRALERAADVDTEKAAQEAARNLLPDVIHATPADTGTMQSGWEAQEGAFINTVEYSGFVEYGTMFMKGAHAIKHTIDSEEKTLLEAFDKGTDDAIRKAGFDR